MKISLDRQTRPGQVSPDGVRITVDTRVPGTLLGRKVYQTPASATWKLDKPHRHNSTHHLLCFAGTCVVALREESDNPVRRIELSRGDSVLIASGVTHQLMLLPESIVASYFPPTTWISKNEELRILDESWLG
jgi:hypothetical protein